MLDNGDDFSGANEVADFDQKAFDLPRYAGADFNFRARLERHGSRSQNLLMNVLPGHRLKLKILYCGLLRWLSENHCPACFNDRIHLPLLLGPSQTGCKNHPQQKIPEFSRNLHDRTIILELHFINFIPSSPLAGEADSKGSSSREQLFARQQKRLLVGPTPSGGKCAKIKELSVYSGIGISPDNLSIIVTPSPSKKNRHPSRAGFLLRPWIWVPFALILALLIILSQIDLESVKENLVQRISRETGLKVEMESIGFGFSQGLGLQLKGVKVRSPKGNSFSVDRLHLLAEWGPLLKGEFKIKSVTLEHPEATLEIPTISPEPLPTDGEKQSEKPLQEARVIDPAKLQSATSKLKSTRLSIKELIVSDGKITLIRAATSKQVSLNFDGTFVLNRSSGEHLEISASAVKLQTGSIIFSGDGIASNLTEDNAGISLNLKSNDFSWEEIQPVLHFFGDPIKEALAPLEAFDVNQLSIRAEIPVSSLSKIEKLQQQMIGHVKLKTRNVVLNMGDKSYPIESLVGEGTLEKGVLAHKFSGTALESDFKLHGELPLFNLEKDSISRVEWKNLVLEKLPFAKGLSWIPTQGKVSGSLSLTGPLLKEKETFPGKLAVGFQVEGLILKPANPN